MKTCLVLLIALLSFTALGQRTETINADCLRIEDGTCIDKDELGYLDGVTSAIQTQIDSLATSSDLSTHEADTSTHGVGVIVGTSEAQALTNKTINADSNTITNIENADIKAGAAIDAAKIHDGTVSNTEFGYLGSVTSDLQTQLGGKVSTTGNESISGTKTFTGKVVSSSTSNGAHPCPSMTDAQMLAIAAPVDGDCVHNSTLESWLIYNSGDTVWQEVGSGGGISDWVTGTDYGIGDVVIESAKIYQANTAHTSGTFATDIANWDEISAAGSGDVAGPASSVDNHIATFNSTTGKIIQDNSTAVLSDAGALSGLTQFDVDNIRADGNTLSSTNSNGNILLSPNGTGSVGIGGTPSASALLDLTSTSKGFKFPTMTTAQRNAIASPAEGLGVVDTDTDTLYMYLNGTWTSLGTGGGGGALKSIGSLTEAGTTNCSRQVTATGSFTSFAADTDCPAPSVTGSITAPATKIPGFVIPSGSPTGKYLVVASVPIYAVTGGSFLAYRISDGSINSQRAINYATNESVHAGMSSFILDISSMASDRTFQVQALTSAGDALINNSTSVMEMSFNVFFLKESTINECNFSVSTSTDAANQSSDACLSSLTCTNATSASSTCSFKSGFFGSINTLDCMCSTKGSTGGRFCDVTSLSTSAISVQRFIHNGSAEDGTVGIYCRGGAP